ncbi:MAG: helix-turn-helix domain-containing protein [Cyclobacteriaceae bacterium]
MKLLEYIPEDKLVGQFIEAYQLFETNNPTVLKAIPNGRVEAWIVSKGKMFYKKEEQTDFTEAKQHSFYPATSDVTTFYLTSPFKCLNIKFRLNLLGLDFFHHHSEYLTELSYPSFLTPNTLESIQQLLESKKMLSIATLDQLIKPSFFKYNYETKVDIALKIVQSASSSMSIGQISDQLGVSTKTLERMTMKYFSITPKKLFKIVRFNNAIKDLKRWNSPRISDTLGNSYFDHSHFVKDCRDITAMSPKDLLRKLELPVTDLYLI